MPRSTPPTIPRDQVVRLWLHCQGLATPRGSSKLTRCTLTDHLERAGALQLDSINAVDRAHYLTLWSRFGAYDRPKLDRWIHRDERRQHVMRLTDVRYVSGRMSFRSRRATEPEWALQGYLAEGKEILLRERAHAPTEPPVELPPEVENLRWFTLPSEASCAL